MLASIRNTFEYLDRIRETRHKAYETRLDELEVDKENNNYMELVCLCKIFESFIGSNVFPRYD